MTDLRESVMEAVESCLSEAVTKEPQRNKKPKDAKEWTFADWFGEDLSGQTYDGDLYFWGSGATSLHGAPTTVNGEFSVRDCTLVDLMGAPTTVNGRFQCVGCGLKSLIGAPKTVDGDFEVFATEITSLVGGPSTVIGSYRCNENRLSSIEGAPKKVGGSFQCNGNPLPSLRGAPEYIGWDFICWSTLISDAVGAPKKIGGNFDANGCRNLKSLAGLGEVGGNVLCYDCGASYQRLIATWESDASTKAMESGSDGSEEVECGWCGGKCPMDEVEEDSALGYVCSRCARAIESRGEDL